MAKDLIKAAQERGITITEDADGGWHGSFIYDAQEYTLDNDTLEALAADMDALVDILESDSFEVDYNEDLDRYLVQIVGFEEPVSDQSLSKAYDKAFDMLNEKMKKNEEARLKREADAAKAESELKTAKEEELAKPKRQKKAAPNGEEPVVPATDEVAEAIMRVTGALTNLVRVMTGQSVIATSEAPPPAPPKRKKGLSKA